MRRRVGDPLGAIGPWRWLLRQFDLIVVGAGSGLEVSSAAAARGLSVAVVEDGPMCGTCLYSLEDVDS